MQATCWLHPQVVCSACKNTDKELLANIQGDFRLKDCWNPVRYPSEDIKSTYGIAWVEWSEYRRTATVLKEKPNKIDVLRSVD